MNKKKALLTFDQIAQETLALVRKRSKGLTPEEHDFYMEGVFGVFTKILCELYKSANRRD